MRLAAVLALSALAAAAAPDRAYRAAIEAWRADREARLKAEDGWLTVVGLAWLNEGENGVGSAPGNDVVLPPDAPARVGAFALRQGKVSVRIDPGVAVTSGGNPVRAMELRPDTSGTPDVLTLGSLSLYVIERQGRVGIRIKDKNAAARAGFGGLAWFPVRESYRVVARFEPYDPPRAIEIPNILGQVERLQSPGAYVFTLGGRELRLDPVFEEPGAAELFVIFRDGTSGNETYGAGRFLYTDLPKDGRVTIDFNKAYSPPCAFTAYATCPLPPKQNRLDVRIEAGEKTPPGHAAHAGR